MIDEGVGRQSLSDQILGLLRQQLVTGELAPGRIYSATGLADRMGVSNSPVREAVLTLVNQGLMEIVKNRGFRVLELTGQELDEIYEIRVLLEVPVVEKISAMDLQSRHSELRELSDKTISAARDNNLFLFMERDREFHLSLTSLLGNQRLVDTIAILRDQTRLYGVRALSESGALVASGLEHSLLLDAIFAGDAESAAARMREHLAHIRTDWATSSG